MILWLILSHTLTAALAAYFTWWLTQKSITWLLDNPDEYEQYRKRRVMQHNRNNPVIRHERYIYLICERCDGLGCRHCNGRGRVLVPLSTVSHITPIMDDTSDAHK